MNDGELIEQYLGGDSKAFAMLVERHAGLVYSAAARQLGDPHEAEDLAQAVFFALSKKARSLSGRKVLSGWLLSAVRLGALHQLRGRRRRQYHERKAAGMRPYYFDLGEATRDYAQMTPVMDSALANLGRKDRDALLLKYYEHKSSDEIAEILGGSPEAARKRVERALEKLRRRFDRQGIVLTLSAVAGGMAHHWARAAPPRVIAHLRSVCAPLSLPPASPSPTARRLLRRLNVRETKAAALQGAMMVGALLLAAAILTGGWELARVRPVSPSPASVMEQ